MSNLQRWSLLALAAIVLVVGFIVLRPKGGDDGSATTTTTTTAAAAPPRTVTISGGAAAPDAPAAKPSPATITVKNGQPVGGVKELDFHKGDTIAFTVTATAPGGEVHFHGYDIAKEIPEGGGRVTYRVPATAEGIFEVEMEDTGVQIAKVVVEP